MIRSLTDCFSFYRLFVLLTLLWASTTRADVAAALTGGIGTAALTSTAPGNDFLAKGQQASANGERQLAEQKDKEANNWTLGHPERERLEKERDEALLRAAMHDKVGKSYGVRAEVLRARQEGMEAIRGNEQLRPALERDLASLEGRLQAGGNGYVPLHDPKLATRFSETYAGLKDVVDRSPSLNTATQGTMQRGLGLLRGADGNGSYSGTYQGTRVNDQIVELGGKEMGTRYARMDHYFGDGVNGGNRWSNGGRAGAEFTASYADAGPRTTLAAARAGGEIVDLGKSFIQRTTGMNMGMNGVAPSDVSAANLKYILSLAPKVRQPAVSRARTGIPIETGGVHELIRRK